MSKTNYNRERKINQGFDTTDVEVSLSVSKDPHGFISSLSNPCRIIFNHLQFLQRKYQKVFIRQDTLAREAGITREWANKCLLILEQHGLVKRQYLHMRINYYKVSSFFFQDHIRKQLCGLLPALRFICLGLLMSNPATKAASYGLFTQYSNLVIKNLKNQPFYQPVIKEGVVMSKFLRQYDGTCPVSKTIKHITKVMGVTLLGQLQLAAFPDEALAYALGQMQYAKSVHNPFGWLCKLALEYCKSNDIEPDRQFTTAMIIHYQVNPSGPVVEDKWKKKVAKEFLYKIPTDQEVQAVQNVPFGFSEDEERVMYGKTYQQKDRVHQRRIEEPTMPAITVDDPEECKKAIENWWASDTPEFLRNLVGNETYLKLVNKYIDPEYALPAGTEEPKQAPSAPASGMRSLGDLIRGVF